MILSLKPSQSEKTAIKRTSSTPESALAIYASGLPVNAVQATATAITLFILANPLLGKLERVRVKYGLAR